MGAEHILTGKTAAYDSNDAILFDLLAGRSNLLDELH
jgi:hypothetical protein